MFLLLQQSFSGIAMLIKTYGSAVYGVNAMNITVEVNAGDGTGYFLIGLPDNAVKESQWRIETAFKNTGLKMPRKKVVINMAPADIRKEGSAYDLTIAVGMLAVSDQIAEIEKVGKYLIMGELSLDGSLLPIKGALPIAIQARKDGYEGFILPKQNAREAAIVADLKVYGAEHLGEVVSFFNSDEGAIERFEVDTRLSLPVVFQRPNRLL